MASEPNTRNISIMSAAVIAIGLLVGGYFVGNGFTRMRTADRTVSVKGVAEREVQADLAIWPLRIVATDDDLLRANSAIEQSVKQVRAFLAENGLGSEGTEITMQEFSVQDGRSTGGYNNTARYIIRQTLVVRSTNVAVVQAASQKIPELVRSGVILSSGQEWGGGGPTFVFTKLNDLKPEMIAEATARAREGGEQFAKDSRSKLGGIRTANQGVFEILPRDQAMGISEESQVMKKVRVVSTVIYALEN